MNATPSLSQWSRWVEAIDQLNVEALRQLRRDDPGALTRANGDGNPLYHLLGQVAVTKTRRRPLLRALLKDVPEHTFDDRPEMLLRAADNLWLEAVERLLPLSNPNVTVPGYVNTPLQHIFHCKNPQHTSWNAERKRVERLLLWNSDPNQQDADGWTIAMYAAQKSDFDVLNDLLEYNKVLQGEGNPGWNLLLRNVNGQTAEDLFALRATSVPLDMKERAQQLLAALTHLRVDQEKAVLRNEFINPSSPALTIRHRERL